jgi:hypothetical protein
VIINDNPDALESTCTLLYALLDLTAENTASGLPLPSIAVCARRHALLLELTPAHTRGNPQLVICGISGEFVVQTTVKSPGSFRIRAVIEADALVKKNRLTRS